MGTIMIEGEKCYYLSVPNENDWAKVTIMEETYNKRSSKECVRTSKDDIKGLHNLIELVVSIRIIFLLHKYTLAKGDRTFYRINVTHASDILTLKVVPDDASSLKDQIKYTGNYFQNEDEAELVAKQLKRIIGIMA